MTERLATCGRLKLLLWPLSQRMETGVLKNISQFYVAGINYKKSDAATRGEFAVNESQYNEILAQAREQQLDEIFILSTCNRTEIYGFAHTASELVSLLCSHTTGNMADFMNAAYIKTGWEAVDHLFRVGAGIDSQILGDYEIVGQLKTAVKFAKERDFVGAFTERLINSVLQASKQIKNQTQLSGGTVSVSFAAVQYIRKHISQLRDKKILLVGTGKIGRNTCRNLVDYTGCKNITLMNRTPEKAAALAAELGLSFGLIEDLGVALRKADIVLVATHATEPVILAQDLVPGQQKLLIDLSIPNNIDPQAADVEGICLVGVDELSRMKDETLRKREAEVPRALAIIEEIVQEFREWQDMRKHVPMLRQLKDKLQLLHTLPQYTGTACTKTIQRVLNETAGKMRVENSGGCHYITALHQFISSKN